jgi:hypothetical protein
MEYSNPIAESGALAAQLSASTLPAATTTFPRLAVFIDVCCLLALLQ